MIVLVQIWCHGRGLLFVFRYSSWKFQFFKPLFLHCSDIVEMASYAPLFVNANDRRYKSHFIPQKLIQACTARNIIFFSRYSDTERNFCMKVESRCDCLQLVDALWNSKLLGAKILQRVKWSNSSWR